MEVTNRFASRGNEKQRWQPQGYTNKKTRTGKNHLKRNQQHQSRSLHCTAAVVAHLHFFALLAELCEVDGVRSVDVERAVEDLHQAMVALPGVPVHCEQADEVVACGGDGAPRPDGDL